MKIITLDTKKKKKEFLRFHAQLYKGDKNYVCMENFVLEDILFQRTKFAKDCLVQPVVVKNGEDVVAQAILIYSWKFPFVQIAFFDALQGMPTAVDLILKEAKNLKEQVNGKAIVVGLNGHISYGVGILTDGFAYKNSFDSIYNKDYYADYFSGGRRQGLSTYKGYLQEAIERLPKLSVSGIRVRTCSLKNYRQEMELMRTLCEQTIAKTDLYFPTEEGHFYELTSALKPFLKAENLLFAEDEKGKTLGFLFFHPDFNQALEGGREYSLMGIATSLFLRKKQIDTVKINAIGSLSPRATNALLQEFVKINANKYTYLETTFIWDNNIKSAKIAQRVLVAAHRKYEVFYFDES